MPLEPEQIERVREIIGCPSFEATETLAGNLNVVQEAATVSDIAEWNKIRNKFSYLDGGKLGLKTDKDPKRLAIRNRVRERLGLFRLTDESDLAYGQDEGPAFAVGCALEDCPEGC